MTEPCKRCGKCCYYIFKEIKYKCKYLIVKKGSKITSCRIYHNRFGLLINKKHDAYCGSIKDATDENKKPIEIRGCVYSGDNYE